MSSAVSTWIWRVYHPSIHPNHSGPLSLQSLRRKVHWILVTVSATDGYETARRCFLAVLRLFGGYERSRRQVAKRKRWKVPSSSSAESTRHRTPGRAPVAGLRSWFQTTTATMTMMMSAESRDAKWRQEAAHDVTGNRALTTPRKQFRLKAIQRRRSSAERRSFIHSLWRWRMTAKGSAAAAAAAYVEWTPVPERVCRR